MFTHFCLNYVLHAQYKFVALCGILLNLQNNPTTFVIMKWREVHSHLRCVFGQITNPWLWESAESLADFHRWKTNCRSGPSSSVFAGPAECSSLIRPSVLVSKDWCLSVNSQAALFLIHHYCFFFSSIQEQNLPAFVCSHVQLSFLEIYLFSFRL